MERTARNPTTPGAVEVHPPFPAPAIETDRARGWVDSTWDDAGVTLPRSPHEALEALFAAEPARWLRRIPGRVSFVLSSGAGEVVVKRFHGDQARERWFERLAGTGVRSPGRRECENLRELGRDGFAVPRPLAWFEEHGAGARSAVVMELVPHAETLRQAAERADEHERERLADELAALAARLHAAGWYHRDLYLEHLVLAEPDGRLVLLDVGRARRQAHPRRRWFVKDLAALLHSTPARVPAWTRLRALARYLDRRGIVEENARRAFARDVAHKAARLAAHAPRFVDGPEVG